MIFTTDTILFTLKKNDLINIIEYDTEYLYKKSAM